MAFLKRNYIIFIGVLVGAMAGYVYWMKLGSSNIKYHITQGLFTTLVYGAVVGGLLSNILKMKFRNRLRN